MPFDPSFPASNVFLVSAEFRAQFNALFDLIQAVPAGPQGMPGTNGQNGGVGPTGMTGAQGPPFAGAFMDAVTTLNPGDPALGSVSFDGTNVHFSFSIPRGNDGPPGMNGADGSTGATGEVSNAQLGSAINSAVASTSSNSNGVATLDSPFGDPDAESLRLKLNELLQALRR